MGAQTPPQLCGLRAVSAARLGTRARRGRPGLSWVRCAGCLPSWDYGLQGETRSKGDIK